MRICKDLLHVPGVPKPLPTTSPVGRLHHSIRVLALRLSVTVSQRNEFAPVSATDRRAPLLGAYRSVQVLEELGWLHFQSGDDPHDVRKRQVAFTSLNTPHVTPVNADVVGKCLLRIAPGFAFGTHPGTKNLQGILSGRSCLRSHAAMFGVRGLKHYGQ